MGGVAQSTSLRRNPSARGKFRKGVDDRRITFPRVTRTGQLLCAVVQCGEVPWTKRNAFAR